MLNNREINLYLLAYIKLIKPVVTHYMQNLVYWPMSSTGDKCPARRHSSSGNKATSAAFYFHIHPASQLILSVIFSRHVSFI